MQYTANSLEEHWLPFTQNKEFKENPRLVVKSEGCYMWDQNGGKILDGSSSLFNVACGHGRPEISEAVYAQLVYSTQARDVRDTIVNGNVLLRHRRLTRIDEAAIVAKAREWVKANF